jgi:hypothetical protein
MVKIEYAPIKKIVVHEIIKVDVPTFLNSVASHVEAQKQGGTPAAEWGEGVAFTKKDFLPTPRVNEEQLDGVIHYAGVIFTEISYQEEKKASINGREVPVKLIKTNNPNILELCRFLRNFQPPEGEK